MGSYYSIIRVWYSDLSLTESDSKLSTCLSLSHPSVNLYSLKMTLYYLIAKSKFKSF